MESSCGSFIRINIFGKTLEQLERSGIDLKIVLANLGCYQVWLEDVPLINFGEIEKSEETLLIEAISSKQNISTSFVDFRDISLDHSFSDEHIPRCSTPNLSTTIPTKNLFESNIVSRIRSEDDLLLPIAEDIADNICVQAGNFALLQSDYEEDQRIITNLLNSMVEILVETESREKHSVCEAFGHNSFGSNESFSNQTALPMFQSPQLYTCRSENIRSNVEAQRFKSLPTIFLPSLDNGGTVQSFDVEPANMVLSYQPSASQPFPPNYEPPDVSLEKIEIDHSVNNQNLQQEAPQDLEQNFEKIHVQKEQNTKCAGIDVFPPTKKQYKKNPDVAARNAVHSIKCQFKDCKTVYKWRPKYGKLRLFDHAMTHLDKTNKLSCHKCGRKSSLRKLREHMSSHHPEEDTRRYSIEEVLKLKVPPRDMKNVWETCFRENLGLVGKPQMTGKKHYVQVNIYGKRLREMNDFELILRDYGCDEFWIGEVPLPNDSSDSGMEDEFISLSSSSTKLAVPRYSTPINSMDRPTLKLFGSEVLSNISESSIERFFDTLDQSIEIPMQDETEVMPISDSFIASRVVNVEKIISNLLRGVIDIVCETEIDEWTVNDYDVKFSTVIQPNVEANSSSTRVQLPTLSGPHPAVRHSEYVSPVQTKPTTENNKSSPNLKIASIPVERVERKPLKSTISEIEKVEIKPRIQNTQSLINLKIANNLLEAPNQSVTQVISVDRRFDDQHFMDGENDIASNMLQSVLDIVCETEIDNTTFENISFLQSSTNDELTATTDTNSSSSQLPTLFGPHPAHRHSEYVPPAELKARIQSTMSLINLKFSNKPDENDANISCDGSVFERELDVSTFYECSNSSFAEFSEHFQIVAEESTGSSHYQFPTLSGPHPASRHSEYVSPVEMKPILRSTRSSKILKIESIPVGRKKRKPLKRTTSEIRRNRRKAMKLIRNNTMNPELVEIPRLIMKPTKVPRELSEVYNCNQTLLPISDESERVYTDLTPVTSDSEQYCEVERNFFNMVGNESLSMPTTSRRDTLYSPREEMNAKEYDQIDDSLLFESDNNEQESWRDSVNEFLCKMNPIRNNFQPIGDDNVLSNSPEVAACSDDSFLSAPDNNLHDDNQGNGKQNAPRKKLARKNKNKNDMEIVHKINCQFENCRKTQNWRTKYGKLRLVDHALSHLNNQSFACDVCAFTCKSTRQIHYHYAHTHPDNQMNTFALKKLLSKPVESEVLNELWKICYKDSLKLIGEPKLGSESKQRMARRKWIIVK